MPWEEPTPTRTGDRRRRFLRVAKQPIAYWSSKQPRYSVFLHASGHRETWRSWPGQRVWRGTVQAYARDTMLDVGGLTPRATAYNSSVTSTTSIASAAM